MAMPPHWLIGRNRRNLVTEDSYRCEADQGLELGAHDGHDVDHAGDGCNDQSSSREFRVDDWAGWRESLRRPRSQPDEWRGVVSQIS